MKKKLVCLELGGREERRLTGGFEPDETGLKPSETV